MKIITPILLTLYIFIAPFPGLASSGSDLHYILRPGDLLEISVWNDEALHREILIRPDGGISFPLIGDIKAAGQSVEDLKQNLEARIHEYIPDTPVTVILKEINHPGVFIVGKVVKPGLYPMENPTTVIQALAMAGGLNPFAAGNSILILRQSPNGQNTYNFRYSDVEKGRGLDQNILLTAGDTIVVP